LADIRIAGAEGDWKSKVEELEAHLQKQNEDAERMRVNYEEEIRLLKENHSREQATLQQEKNSSEMQARIDVQDASDKISSLESRVAELMEATESQKSDAKAQIQKMQEEMDNSEQVRDEIKQKLAQARDMVTAAEHDWTEKNSALEKVIVNIISNLDIS
jgi:chromosome segregation ATPase